LSIRFQADNDLKRIIVDATLRHEPRIDFQTAQAARLGDLDDEAVLQMAASQSRILVSHDKRTMPGAVPRSLHRAPRAQACFSLSLKMRRSDRWLRH
jgi:hypothetical protein